MTTNGSYRPRNPGHDYFGRGTYLITLVVTGRRPLLGSLSSDATHPEVQVAGVPSTPTTAASTISTTLPPKCATSQATLR